MDPKPFITLTTDFGTTDAYVAAMKGVIYSINPACIITDVSHHVGPQDIIGAGFLLASVYRYFPEGTIHCAVVDPGVGTSRRPLIIQASGFFFVGPDNGLFSFVLSGSEPVRVHVITNPDYTLTPPSTTFHGRDVFAPAAAYLSGGTDLSAFGTQISDYCVLPVSGSDISPDGTLCGAVIHIDRFGNIITNITGNCFEGFAGTGPFRLTIQKHACSRRVETYAQAHDDELFCLIGSSGYLEVSVKNASARDRTGARAGDPVCISRKS